MHIGINNRTRSKIDLRLVKKVAEKFLQTHNKNEYEVSIAFVGDKKIRELNKIYRKKDQVTDVLAFRGEGRDLGEVIIDYAQIKRQAKRFSNNEKQELVFILVHGLLHLLGYEDETERGEKEMEKLSKTFINQL